MAIEYRCERCSGTQVMAEAWAEWDCAHQQWRVAETFDYAVCHDCLRQTRLVAHSIADGRPN
jgi:hypothetical protein